MRLTGWFLGALIMALVGTADAQQTIHYSVTKAVPIGLPDRWDYVVFDSVSGRVYASHGNTVSVVDGQSGKSIGTIKLGPEAVTHGVLALGDLGKGYTDDSKAGVVVVFDLKTLKMLHTIKA